MFKLRVAGRFSSPFEDSTELFVELFREFEPTDRLLRSGNAGRGFVELQKVCTSIKMFLKEQTHLKARSMCEKFSLIGVVLHVDLDSISIEVDGGRLSSACKDGHKKDKELVGEAFLDY
jgi:hypothetical protein